MKLAKPWRWPEVALLIIILLVLTLIAAVLASRYLPIPFSAGVSPADKGSSGTITTGSFTTAFMLADNTALAVRSYQEHLLFRVVPPLAVGIIGLLYAGALLVYSLIVRLKPKSTTYRIVIGAVIAIWVGIGGLNLFNAIDVQHISDCARLQSIYEAHQFRITEGIVHVSHVQSTCDRGTGDIIKVGNASFEVCYYVSTCAYKQSIAHGGTLTEGTFARIYYMDYRTILRIDIKKQ